FDVGHGDEISFNLDVLNSYRVRYRSNATVTVSDGDLEIHKAEFSFAPNWEVTTVPVEFYFSGVESQILTVTVTNSDGFSTSVDILVQLANYSSLMIVGILGLVILALLWKTK
ncbi:MAG: hypothetical protein RTU30_14690, partial [Candidatus Thorarchaeota archaeon]